MKKLSVLFTTLAVAATLSLAGCANTVSSTPDLPVTHTVTFVTKCASSIASQTVEDGQLAKQPDQVLTNGSYTFAGWYNGTNKYQFTEPVTSDLTLVAKWTTSQESEVRYDSTVHYYFGDEVGYVILTYKTANSGTFSNHSVATDGSAKDREEYTGDFEKASEGFTFKNLKGTTIKAYDGQTVSYKVEGNDWTQHPITEASLFGFGNKSLDDKDAQSYLTTTVTKKYAKTTEVEVE